jgi:predicted ATPase/DNA-binding winged helix-turn-helix (wHTH) protein
VTTTVDVEFTFGPFRLIPGQRKLVRENRPVKLGGRALDILHLLVMRAGEEVSKNELIEFAWPRVFVDERNLKVHVSSLRRALCDTGQEAPYIATVVGHGYQFVERVEREQVEKAAFTSEDHPFLCEPPALSPLIGRQRDVEAVARALDFASLVTLVGPGGVGKTRLAIAIAHATRYKFPDGLHFLDLSASDDPALVPHLIAAGLGVRSGPEDLVSTVIKKLRDRRILVVLDNCEHVLHAAASVAARFVEAKINCCLLATSREPLGICGENVQRVEPLAFPDPLQVRSASVALAYPAVELFALRALDAADYQLIDRDVNAVASLCKALDGLPLAIEIAAAKLDQFSPVELLESVHRALGELRNDDEALHRRHRTLWATLDWSYQLLSSEESMIFRLLSVFEGFFEWTDVTAMAGLMRFDASQTTIALGNLVAKSMLSAEMHAEQLRYRFLESARCYAAERLRQDSIAHAARRRHAQIVLSAFERSQSEWAWVDAPVWRKRYEARSGDLRKALDWCFSDVGDASLGIDLVIAATRYWNEQSPLFEQLSQVERALGHCSVNSADQRTATLAASRAWCMGFGDRLDAATDDAWNTALHFADLGDDVSQRLSVRCDMALFLAATGRIEQTERLLDDVARIAADAGDRAALIDSERLRAMLEARHGNLLKARNKLERLAEDLSCGMPQSRHLRYQLQAYVSTLGMLAFSSWLTGSPERALTIVEEMVLKTGHNGHLLGQSRALALFALPVALWSGRFEAFKRYLSLLEGNLDRGKIALWRPDHRFYAGAWRHACGDPGAVDEMQLAVDDMVRGRFLLRTPMYLGVLAEALCERGRFAEAGQVVESALALQRQLQESWCLSELLRVKARLMAGLGKRGYARALLGNARKEAVTTGAKTLELRIVNDMVQMASAEENEREAMQLLRPLYASFADGEVTEDLMLSSRLLAAVSGKKSRPQHDGT